MNKCLRQSLGMGGMVSRLFFLSKWFSEMVGKVVLAVLAGK